MYTIKYGEDIYEGIEKVFYEMIFDKRIDLKKESFQVVLSGKLKNIETTHHRKIDELCCSSKVRFSYKNNKFEIVEPKFYSASKVYLILRAEEAEEITIGDIY